MSTYADNLRIKVEIVYDPTGWSLLVTPVLDDHKFMTITEKIKAADALRIALQVSPEATDFVKGHLRAIAAKADERLVWDKEHAAREFGVNQQRVEWAKETAIERRREADELAPPEPVDTFNSGDQLLAETVEPEPKVEFGYWECNCTVVHPEEFGYEGNFPAAEGVPSYARRRHSFKQEQCPMCCAENPLLVHIVGSLAATTTEDLRVPSETPPPTAAPPKPADAAQSVTPPREQ